MTAPQRFIKPHKYRCRSARDARPLTVSTHSLPPLRHHPIGLCSSSGMLPPVAGSLSTVSSRVSRSERQCFCVHPSQTPLWMPEKPSASRRD